ncbi:carcinoembryonic antigen-related cell adhesion molecule 5-like [Xenopus tropicalis]|uniref:Carcinoembryonic antigen-related cell adhesion molecule 5-like n=1 Tax=Xenopus tropicalis TaxID=8364 RepID=A0A8J1JWX5_XENTR|nr:carcinoembryonic antigen-related cell adhesion molecule 5-like [Xenopus tropicalis]
MKYTSKSTKDWLKTKKWRVLEWSSHSPDLNPIEMLWGDLKRAVHAINPSNISQVKEFCIEEWGPLTPPTLRVNVSTTNGNAYPVNDTIVSLHCDAGGQNVVNYTFYQNGVTACSQPYVTCDKDFLYFQPITMSDTGTYTCKIENPISSNTSQPLSLTVIERVSGVVLNSNASSWPLWAGKASVRLTCSALGTNVTFSWHLDGAPLPTNPRYHLMNSNSSLIISPVERTDNGSFTCTASNSVNSETSSPLTLSLGWSPDKDILCEANPTGQNVTLLCSWEGGNPSANVTLEFKNINETRHDTVSKTVLKTNVITNDSLSCRGSQYEQQSCKLLLARPIADVPNPDTSVEEGKSATMTVNLISNKRRADSPQILPTTFTWINPHNQTLSNGDTYKINSSDYSSELVIFSPKVNDSGTYQCAAENFMGKSTFVFTLRVQQGPPSPPPKPPNPLSAGAIAGIVIGSLAGVALIGTAVFFIVKSTKKKHRNRSSGNAQMTMSGVADKNQENEEYVKYADLRFKNANPGNKAPVQQVAETEYSTVKK